MLHPWPVARPCALTCVCQIWRNSAMGTPRDSFAVQLFSISIKNFLIRAWWCGREGNQAIIVYITYIHGRHYIFRSRTPHVFIFGKEGWNYGRIQGERKLMCESTMVGSCCLKETRVYYCFDCCHLIMCRRTFCVQYSSPSTRPAGRGHKE